MKKRLLFIVIAFSMSIAACQSKDDNNALPEKSDNNNDITNVQDSSTDTKKDLTTNREIAEHLANIADSVPNVIDAASVVAGPYTVVGIDVDKDLDKSRVGTVKYSVTESLQHDPYGKTAVVVADGDITQRLQSMGNKVKQGEPVQGIVEELTEIVERYMPDSHMGENQPNNPDYNKEEDEENLDDTTPNPSDVE